MACNKWDNNGTWFHLSLIMYNEMKRGSG